MVTSSLLRYIAGDIASNERYGIVMKKWRNFFNITQSRIAKEMNVKQSVISDYENNRRASPGINIIRSYVLALIKIAKKEHPKEYNELLKSLNISEEKASLYKGRFKNEFNNKDIMALFNATQVIAPKREYKFKEFVFFSKNISSIVTNQPSYKFLKQLRSNTNRLFIFSNVKRGQIPLITITLLSKINHTDLPKLILFQSNKFKISNLARRIAKSNNISIMITKMDNKTILDTLRENCEEMNSSG